MIQHQISRENQIYRTLKVRKQPNSLKIFRMNIIPAELREFHPLSLMDLAYNEVNKRGPR